MATKKARVLTTVTVGGKTVHANTVVVGDAAVIKSLVDGGHADDAAAAVKYAESLGGKAVEIGVDEAQDAAAAPAKE